MRKLSITSIIVCFIVIAFSFAHAAEVVDQEKPEPVNDASAWSDMVKKDDVGPETMTAIKPIVPRFEAPESFHGLVEMVSNSVVNISTSKKKRVRPYNPFQGFGGRSRRGDPFDDFFDRFFEGMPERHFQQQSLGSGFIFKPDGHILTNNHVVANSDEIIVRLSDEHEYKAKIIGRDEETDLAVIKIEDGDKKDFPYVPLGNSGMLNIGDWVMAIGNPFGLSHTVTAGIVSAKGRVIGAGPYDNFIQTDASINPGNSGGPLFNMKGEVVGINTAIYASGQGLGFAIPVNMAKKLVPQLIAHGKVMDRGWLGVMIQGITPELAKSFGLPEDQKGALIGDVVPGSPADKAGLKRGDVIIKFNDQEVKKSTELPRIVATTAPGIVSKVVVIREGKEETFDVTLGKRDKTKQVAEKDTGSTDVDKVGLVVAGITASDAHELAIPPDKGVLVKRVEPGSAAEEAGIRTNDVIYEVNGAKVNSVAEYNAATKKLEKGKIARLLIRRQGGTIYLAFTL